MKHIIFQRHFCDNSELDEGTKGSHRELNLLTKIHLWVKPQLGVSDQQRQFLAYFQSSSLSRSYLRSGSLQPIAKTSSYEIWDTAQCTEGAIST